MTRQQKKKIDESHVEEVRSTTFSMPNYNEDPVRWLLLSKAKAKARAPLGHRSSSAGMWRHFVRFCFSNSHNQPGSIRHPIVAVRLLSYSSCLISTWALRNFLFAALTNSTHPSMACTRLHRFRILTSVDNPHTHLSRATTNLIYSSTDDPHPYFQGPRQLSLPSIDNSHPSFCCPEKPDSWQSPSLQGLDQV